LSCGILRGFTDKLPADSLCGQLGQPPETSQLYRYSGLSRELDEVRLIVILPGDDPSWGWLRDLLTLRFARDHSGEKYQKELHNLNTDMQRAASLLNNAQGLFCTHYSMGISDCYTIPGDEIFAIDGVRHLFILRKVSSGVYRIVEKCHLWGGMNLNYWHHGIYIDIWTRDPSDLVSERTRTIEIY
jgi:hypothetical protein